jgi:glycosidase
MIREAFRVRLVVAVALLMLLSITALADEGLSSGTGLKKVTFTFSPMGRYDEVFLAGTFNGWSTDVTPMTRKGDRYTVSIPLPVGEYQYKFVADGQWFTDETARRFHPDGYGGRNSVIDVDESFETWDMARGDGRIMLDGLRHREDAWERSLNADGTATLRLRTWTGDVEEVELCWAGMPHPEPGRVMAVPYTCRQMERFDSDGTYDYFETSVRSPRFSYYFRLTDGADSSIVDRKGARRAPSREADSFVFDATEAAAFTTPDWVKEGIIYQIFPERFANGNPDNDPDFSEWYYEDLTELPPSGKTNGEYFHLIDDWYDVAGLKVSPYKTDGKPDWNSFYGGDIEGIGQNLDYLVDLGVTVIYFNPIFEAKSNHKYDAATYMKVDPHFATNDEFKDFVTDCHAHGIRVVIDLAFNHTGHTYWAFVDAREKGRESEYWNWYEWKQWPLPGSKVWTPHNASDYYDCWWGFGQMPNLNFDLARSNPDEQKIKDIDEAQPNWPVVNRLLDAAEFWLAEMDVDGYRLDVAADVPFWFWELFRERVKQTKPDAYIVGELWGASPEWVNGRYYDAVMNYKFFRDPVLGFIARGDMSAQEFDRALAPGRLIYPGEGVRAQMNLLGSHDTERFLTTAGGDIRKLKLAALFGMTYVGAPTIYYGDEVAMSGGGDPDCRRPFYWKWREEAERVEVHDYFRSLASLRREHPCFTAGEFRALLAEGQVYAFERSQGDDIAIVVMNAGREVAAVDIPLRSDIRSVHDGLTHAPVPLAVEDGRTVLRLALRQYAGNVYLLSRR